MQATHSSVCVYAFKSLVYVQILSIHHLYLMVCICMEFDCHLDLYVSTLSVTGSLLLEDFFGLERRLS